MHDTNASYILYKKLFFNKFTLISTGTWFVIINNSAKKDSLKSNKDKIICCLCLLLDYILIISKILKDYLRLKLRKMIF